MLNISLINTDYDTVHIPQKTMLGTLHPIESKNTEVSNVSWTKENTNTANSAVELLSISPESSIQPGQNNLKQMILQQDAQIPQEAKGKLSLLLEVDYDNLLLKSPMDVGRKKCLQIDIPTAGPTAQKPYPILLKYQKFIDEENGFWKMQDA